jgi:putative membrane protein
VSSPPPTPVRPARRLSPLTPLLKGPIIFLAILGGAWQQLLDPQARAGSIVFVGLALLAGVTMGALSWLRTTYWIDENELRIDTGLLSRQSRRIRIDRLQGVDIVQPFVARLFGHAQLNFDVAGGDTEGSLAFMPLREAEEVRSVLLERRDRLRPGPGEGTSDVAGVAPGPMVADPAGPGGPPAARPAAEPLPEVELARLDLGMLAASTLVSFGALAFGAAVLLSVATVLATGSVAAVVGVALPAMLASGFALVRQVNANHGHVVTRTPAGLVLRRGLFSLSRQTVALPRVQGVRISEPVLWRPFGWARLEVSVAGATGGAEQHSVTSSVLMPVAPRALVRGLAVHALRGLDPDAVLLAPVPARARWRAPVSARWLALGATPTLVVSRRGFLTRRTDAVPARRVQSLGLVQGPWSRRLQLADLEVHSPIGTVRVLGRFRDHTEARAWLDRLIDDTRAARLDGEGPARPRM